MSLKAGIVGLPNVGKSTLFNAITKKNILAANYPFATIEPNVGVVTVPDYRLDKLTEMYNPKKTVPTTFEFTDIAGLVKGASKGEGLGNKFLSHIREVDAIVEVVRCFDDGKIIHVDGTPDPIRDIETINLELAIADLDVVNNRFERVAKKARTTKNKDDIIEVEALEKAKQALLENIPLRQIDPIRDLEIINTELILADLEIVENRISKIEKKAETTKDKAAVLELTALRKSKEALEQGSALRNVEYTDDELVCISGFNFITLKKIIYAANVNDEDAIAGSN